MSAFSKNVLRCIRGSLGRFFAIMGIVALGCGFYAGLKMCGPIMRMAADAYFDGTNLYDLRLISTLGLGDADIERLGAVEGVDNVMANASYDSMVRMGERRVVMRFNSLDVSAAQESNAQGPTSIVSAQDGYINRVLLCEGRWPQKKDECAVGAERLAEGVGVGDRIELIGKDDDDCLLDARSFLVTGLVKSSSYPYMGSFGSTSLGSGMVQQYAYVLPRAFKDEKLYTTAYATVSDARVDESGSDEYEERVDAVSERIEGRLDTYAQSRLDDVKGEAQEELDNKRDEYLEERQKALDELDDGQRKLDEAQDELREARKKLEDGRAEYEQGLRTYEDERDNAYEQLDNAQRDIDAGWDRIGGSRLELEAGKSQFEDGLRAYQDGVDDVLQQTGTTSLAEARSTLEKGVSEAEEGTSKLESAIGGAQVLADGQAQWDAGRDELLAGLAGMGVEANSLEEALASLNAMIAGLEAMGAPSEQVEPLRGVSLQVQELMQSKANLDVAREELLGSLRAQGIDASDEHEAIEKLQTQLEEVTVAKKQAQQGLEGIQRLEAAQDELDKSAAELADGEQRLSEGQDELVRGQAELDDQRSNALQELEDGRAKLDEAEEELEDGREKLESGTKEYEDSRTEFEDARTKAHEELADAERKLEDAQKDIDDIELPEVHVLGRDLDEGVASYDADSRRIDAIADVFPLMFFVVAALVALTSMTRMVEDDRIEMGTYKALGYGTLHIATKYLVYAGLASGIGAAVGIAFLTQLLPFVVTFAYASEYSVPLMPFPLPVRLDVALISGGLGIGVTLVATMAAVVSSLREVPATLMLPRAPVSGKRILLERVRFVWKRLSFSWKVTCRNLFRYKRRLAMTVVGISGCAALLLVGFGLRDSLWDILACQYGYLTHYDVAISFNEDAREEDERSAMTKLSEMVPVKDTVMAHQENMLVGVSDTDEKLLVQVVVPQEEDRLNDAVSLQDRMTATPIPFDGRSVVITEKIALKYGLGVGDRVLLYEQDAIGNAVGSGDELEVTGISENYVGNAVYVGNVAWKSIAGPADYKTAMAIVDANTEQIDEACSVLRELEGVSVVTSVSETVEKYSSILWVVDMVVVLLIVSAGALAFIVLYNLTNINITERIREIASLKVLGFTRHEVYSYVFREIGLLTALGSLVGVLFGTWLETFVIEAAEVDYLMFGRSIHPQSYAFSFLLTMVFCLLILFGMRKKLDNVNMVESLKSVD